MRSVSAPAFSLGCPLRFLPRKCGARLPSGELLCRLSGEWIRVSTSPAIETDTNRFRPCRACRSSLPPLNLSFSPLQPTLALLVPPFPLPPPLRPCRAKVGAIPLPPMVRHEIGVRAVRPEALPESFAGAREQVELQQHQKLRCFIPELAVSENEPVLDIPSQPSPLINFAAFDKRFP